MQVKSESEVAQSLATPWTAAYQAPPAMGFSRQEYWSGVPLLMVSQVLDTMNVGAKGRSGDASLTLEPCVTLWETLFPSLLS